MTYDHRTHQLRGRHSLLEAALIEARRRPAPDPLELTQIKKRKLQLKDRLFGLNRPVSAS